MRIAPFCITVAWENVAYTCGAQRSFRFLAEGHDPTIKKIDPARQVTLQAEPDLSFSFKRFPAFSLEMYEKLARPG